MAIYTFPARPIPARPQLRVLRSRRTWWTRFMDPRELFGLKVTMLVCCFLLAAMLGA
ncbi:MAG TPA: hypothetical protein V6D05_18945 [Stenomitos sp.]